MVGCEHCGAPLVMDLRNRCRTCGKPNGFLRTIRGRTTAPRAGAEPVIRSTGRTVGASPAGAGSDAASPRPQSGPGVVELPGVVSRVESWADAEQLGLAVMRNLGFVDATLTRAGADGGIDVMSANAVCQVKHLSGAAGRPAVQQLHGSALGRTAIFLSARYSADAIKWGSSARVALFTFDERGVVRAVSPAAFQLVADRATGAKAKRAVQLAARVDTVRRWHRDVETALRRLEASPAGTGRHRRKLIKKIRSARVELAALRREFAKLEKVSSVRVASSARTTSVVESLEGRLRKLAKLVGVTLT